MSKFLTSFSVVFALVLSLQVPQAVAADAHPADPAVKCVLAVFMPVNGSGRGFHYSFDSGEDPAMTKAERRVFDACLEKIGSTKGGYIIPMPYLVSHGQVRWKVEVVACSSDGSAYVFKGAIRPEESVRVPMRDKVSPGNKYCR